MEILEDRATCHADLSCVCRRRLHWVYMRTMRYLTLVQDTTYVAPTVLLAELTRKLNTQRNLLEP